MTSQIDRAKVLLQGTGLDLDLFLNEVAGTIKDSLPPPDVELETKLTNKLIEQTGNIVTGLKEQIQGIKTSLQTEIESIKAILLDSVQAAVEAQFQASKDAIIAGIATQLQGGAGEPAGAGVAITHPGGRGNLDTILPLLLEKVLKPGGGDNFDGLLAQMEKLGKLREAFNAFSDPTASPDAQWRFGQAAFIEGMKVGKAGKGGATANPLPAETSINPSAGLENLTLKRRKSDVEIIRELVE